MRGLDLTSWQSLLTGLIGLALVTLIGIGIRLVIMQTIQQRQQRLNRQINERLRTLIAAYKVLGGSFTGNLSVDPTHLRDLRPSGAAAGGPMAGETEAAETVAAEPGSVDPGAALGGREPAGAEASERRRRIRDAVEAALSDIILLGTEEQVKLAARAATELVAGRPVETDELVVSLRNFIRQALDLAPIPADLVIPDQGPTRPASGGKGGGKGGERGEGGGREGGGGGGMGGMGGGMAGMGGGMGGGMLLGGKDESQGK